MRNRERVLQSLENVYRGAFTAAETAGDKAEMARLDLEYQREQLHLEVMLDIRDLLTPSGTESGVDDAMAKTTSFLEKAQQLRLFEIHGGKADEPVDAVGEDEGQAAAEAEDTDQGEVDLSPMETFPPQPIAAGMQR